VTGRPSTADNAISYSSFRGKRGVNPITGKSSYSDNAIRYDSFKKRESKKRNSHKAKLNDVVKRPKFGLAIDKFVSNEVVGTANGIKTEVDDYRLDF